MLVALSVGCDCCCGLPTSLHMYGHGVEACLKQARVKWEGLSCLSYISDGDGEGDGE